MMHTERHLQDALRNSYRMAHYLRPFADRGMSGAQRYAVMATLSEEAQSGRELAALVPASTETRWFQELCLPWEVLFLRGRIRLPGYRGSPPWPPAVVRMGPQAERATIQFVTITDGALRPGRRGPAKTPCGSRWASQISAH